MEFKPFNTARRSLKGFGEMNMICKRQLEGIAQCNSVGQAKFILFGVNA
jgi:hypothetical protein